MKAPSRLRRLARIGLALALLGAIAVLAGGQMGLFSGTRPANLGVNAGKLAPCKPSPNCVSSQADQSDSEHYIAPIAFSGDAAKAWDALKRAVAGMPGAVIVSEQPGYLYATYASRFMGFMDDAEFALDTAGSIHVRSASRLGRKDFGVNRARIEALRARFVETSRP